MSATVQTVTLAREAAPAAKAGKTGPLIDAYAVAASVIGAAPPSMRAMAGTRIIVEGEPGTSMFVIRTGKVELTIQDRLVDVLNPGDPLGEMAMIDSDARSATATAMVDCDLLQVDRPLFEAMIRAEPTFAIHVMRAMVKRMRRMQMTMQA